eukprot:Nitzschia sp. Nitz4//scaffold214_size40253//13027//15296//NITZ4_007587-RA/size40253-processed-gene-0.2-mRNA-1//1//CDS//3329542099//3408//frame0
MASFPVLDKKSKKGTTKKILRVIEPTTIPQEGSHDESRNTTHSNGNTIPEVGKKRLRTILPRPPVRESGNLCVTSPVLENSQHDSRDHTAVVLTGEIVDELQDEAAKMVLVDLQAQLQKREGQQIVEATPVENTGKLQDGDAALPSQGVRQWRQTWILLVVIVIGGIVAVPVVLISSSSSASESATSTVTPSPMSSNSPITSPTTTTTPTELLTSSSHHPSMSPSQFPTYSPRVSLLQGLLSISDFNTTAEWGEHLLSNPGSSQAQTIDWLGSKDEYHSLLLANKTDMSIQLLQERYALVVLYFSTSGLFWETSEDYYLNTTSSVCAWHNNNNSQGILCDSDGFVQEVLLVDCLLVGTVPSELSLLKKLDALDLSRNDLTALPSQLGEFSVKYLTLESNYDLKGPLPPLPSTLISLRLSNNDLSATLPSEWGSASSTLYEIIAEDCNLQGPIPSEWGSMDQLAYLHLSGNTEIGGTIPSELGSLSNLISLTLAHTNVEGQLPSEMGNLENLEIIDLFYNWVTGTMPTEVGLMTSLTTLYLEYNHFTGTIPTEVGLMTSLISLQLSNNFLTGTIPTEVGYLLMTA